MPSTNACWARPLSAIALWSGTQHLMKPALAAAALTVLLCSCASVSLRKVQVLSEPRRPYHPRQILVKPFDFHDPAVRADRTGLELEAFRHDMREKMTRHLVREFSREIAPARPVARTAPPPRGKFWLVTGRFDRIEQGSRILRSLVGFGSGATALDTSVVVYDLSARRPVPLLLIETTGGSNAPPPMAADSAYLFSASMSFLFPRNFLDASRSGLTFDAIRTSRTVTQALSEYLAARGAPGGGNSESRRRCR